MFLHFVINFDVSAEFEFYEEELSIVLKGRFAHKSRRLLFFILKIFLRYLIGELDSKDCQQDEAFRVHKDNISSVKECICHFLERLMENIRDEELLPQIALQFLNILSTLLEKSL